MIPCIKYWTVKLSHITVFTVSGRFKTPQSVCFYLFRDEREIVNLEWSRKAKGFESVP